MNETSKAKKGLYGLLAAIGITAGAAGIAAAATSQSSPSTTTTKATTEQGQEHEGHDDGDHITSSIIDKASANEAEGVEEDDAAEAARLTDLATVSEAQAKEAALAAVPGKVTKVQLESEDGSVLYDVEVITADGTTDVTIDAGNAKVLQTEKETGETNDGPEHD